MSISLQSKKLEHYFLPLLLVGVVILTFFILRPFMYVIVLALVSVTIFEPIHQKMLAFSYHTRWLAALCTTALIVVVILIPLIILGVIVFQEAQQYYGFLTENGGTNAIVDVFDRLAADFQIAAPGEQKIAIDADQYVKQGLAWLVDHLGYVFSSITKLVFNFFIFIVVVYFALKDGDKFKKFAIDISPLKDNEDEAIFNQLKLAINSVVRGSLVVAVIQGALVALGFFMFGVPNAILWGAVATLASLVPGVGTALVVIPGVIYVFLTQQLWMAVGLLAWGTLVVGLIDNVLKPKLIGDGIKIHPLIVFLSVLGGIAFFGPMGFLLGPLVMSLLFALLNTYSAFLRNH